MLRRHALDSGRPAAGGGRAPVPGPRRGSSPTRPPRSAGRRGDRLGRVPCLTPDAYAQCAGRRAVRPCPSTRWPRPSPPTRTGPAPSPLARPRRRADPVGRPAPRRRRLRRGRALAVPAPLRRRVPGREPGPVPPGRGPGSATGTTSAWWATPTRPSTAGTGPTRACYRPAPAGRGHAGGPPGREPPVHAPGGGGGHGRPGPAAVAPPRSAAPDGPLPVVTAYDDDAAEAEGVVAPSSNGPRTAVLVGSGRAGPYPRPTGRGGAGAGPGRHPLPDRPGPRSTRRRPAPGRRGGADGPGPPDGPAGPAGTRGPDGGDDAVELATFHRAKGLEWARSRRRSGGRLRAHRLRRRRPQPVTRSAASSMWRSPGPLWTSTARGPGPGAWARAGRSTGSPRPGWPRWPGCRRTGSGHGRRRRRPVGRASPTMRDRSLRLTGRAARRPISRPTVSMNTGVWSDGFSPLRALPVDERRRWPGRPAPR